MRYDSIVVGGGFYGCYLATLLKKKQKNVLILEQEADILTRASYVNQARVHNGYHYPRNYITAMRSAINFPQFVLDFYPAIDHTFEKLYAVARNNSKVTSEQFFSFCKKIHAPIEPASDEIKQLFDENLIEDVYKVKEFAFDASIVRKILRQRIEGIGVELLTSVHVDKVLSDKNGQLTIEVGDSYFETKEIYVCAYSGINKLISNSDLPILPMKHEITEMALVRLPNELENLAITVMDGPFFSIMPFPDKNLHTLSHVRYTPHTHWIDEKNKIRDPYKILYDYEKRSNYQYMIHDAQRYIPKLAKTNHIDSLYEIKTVLVKNEDNDGRPILFQKDHGYPGLSIIMGGKIDNIYDIISAMKHLSVH